MAHVILDKSISLDGFVAGPNDEIEPLHDWIADPSCRHGQALLEELFAETGAVVMGRRTFSMVDGPDGWRFPDGAGFELPVVVLTHEAREPVTKGVTSFSFTAGIDRAMALAGSAAAGRSVSVMGGETGRQALAAGLVDELVLHVVPVLLGRGIPLFGELDHHVTFERTDVLVDPTVTHTRYRVVRD